MLVSLYKKISDVVYKKYRNMCHKSSIKLFFLNKYINVTYLCTKYKWCRNVQWTLGHQCRNKCLASEVSVHQTTVLIHSQKMANFGEIWCKWCYWYNFRHN